MLQPALTMSYGNTPMTDSDEDVNLPNGPTSGGFTETTLDEANQTPMSDDSDNNENEINMNENSKYFVRIYYEGTLETFEITRYETLIDLRRRINERDDMAMSECHYFLLQRDNNSDDLNLDEFDEEDEDELIASGRLLENENIAAMEYNKQTLSIYWKSFDLTIVDGMDLTLPIRVSQDWTIKRLKDEVETRHSVRLQCLSYQGMELTDNQQLQYHEINKSGYTLISRISITIEDQSCLISTDLLICDFWDFEKVLTTYLDAERREGHKNASFYYLGSKIPLTEQVLCGFLLSRLSSKM